MAEKNSEFNDVSANLREESSVLWNEALEEYISGKKMKLKTQAEVDDIIRVLREAKKDGVRKERREYYILKRYRFEVDDDDNYSLLTTNGDKVPIKENLFNLLYHVHKECKHGGINAMYASQTLKQYEGITKSLIGIFLKCCQSCQAKKKNKVATNVVNPIEAKYTRGRYQMAFIDLQSTPDADFKYILNYHDRFTKYCLLRPLKSKNAKDIAALLKLIICDFGPCRELQIINDCEFENSSIETLIKKFGGNLIRRESQNQASVERANQDIQNILTILMERRNTTKWSELLPEVQLIKNTKYHVGIENTPYKALFGYDSVYENDLNLGDLEKQDGDEESEMEDGEEKPEVGYEEAFDILKELLAQH